MSLAAFPGFSAFAPDLQTLLLSAEEGDHERRAELLVRVADALNVLVGLELLEFVFVPPGDVAGEGTIDLIAPQTAEPAAVAWFGIAEAGYDEYRDAVGLFGDLSEILNPPIVLDVDEAAADGL